MKKRIVSVLCIFVFLLSACGTTAQEQRQENTVITIGCKDGSPLPQALVELGTALGYDLEPVYYSQDRASGRWEALEADLIAGDGPDLILGKSFGLGPEHPEKNEYFADLGLFLADDPDLNLDSLVPVFLRTYAPEGKLYYVTDSFYIDTVIARKSLGLEQFCYEALEDLIDAYGPEQIELWTQGISGVLDSWVALEALDTEAETLSFTGTEFKQALDCYLALRAAEPDEETFSPEGLLYYGTIGSFYDLQYYRAAFGEDISLVGIPGQTGLLWGDSAYAINQNSSHQEEAWNILRQLLLPEYQQEHSSGFPTNQEALQALAQAVQNRDPTEAEWAFSAFPLDVTLGPASAEDTELLLAWMDTAQLQPTGLYSPLWLQSSTLLTQAIEAQPQGNLEDLALWMQNTYEQEESE